MTKTLFTGAEGFFGTSLLRQNTNWIASVQHKDVADTMGRDYQRKIFTLDITNYDQAISVLSAVKPDRILHLAAQSRPDVSWNKPIETIDTNIIGTMNILKACNQINLKPIILLASTSAQYGETFEIHKSHSPINEDSQEIPMNPYGVSKSASESLSKLFAQYYELDIRYARIFNTSGYGKIGDVISDFCRRILESSDKHISVGNLKPIRCFLHVHDTLLALEKILDNGLSGEVYNICSENEFSIKQIFNIICQISNKSVEAKIQQSLLRPTDEPIIKGSSEKLKSLGWSEKYNIEDIIRDCLKYFDDKNQD